MVGRVARAGGAALAVLAMAAGGVVAGGGGAGAFSVDPGSTAGAPVCKPFTDEDELPQALCDDLRFEAYAPVGDFDVWLSGRERVYAGENHAVRAGFRARKAGVELSSATVRTPHGFEFKGGTVKLNGTEVEATFTVDPATGDVTVAAPGGGWTGNVNMELTYRAGGLSLTAAETALRFSGSGVPDSGWVLKGATNTLLVPSWFDVMDWSGSSQQAEGEPA
ncbi:hypothetical protein ACWDUM_10505 [Rhodococcus sp. NPDC003322]